MSSPPAPAPLPLRHRLVLALLPSHVREEHARELQLSLTHDGVDLSWGTLLLDVLRAAPGAHGDVLRQDLRLALRQLHRAPSFALIAIITLSLGLGGNFAFFTLVDSVLFQPLHLRGESRLVSLTEENLPRGMRTFGMSPANFLDYTRDSTLFQAATAYQVRSGTLRAGETQERVLAASVSGEFFRVFLEPPTLGRVLEPSDDVVGSNVVVVSRAFHATVLGGDPAVLGREIELDGQKLRIVGVLADDFVFPDRSVALWRPLAMSPTEWERRGARFVSAVARLRDGVDPARASTRLARVAEGLATAHPETNKEWTVLVRDLRASRVDSARAQLYVVWAAGTLVLLVALANVAGLFITRAVTRQREFALRSALGARAGRVARQVGSEALLLTTVSTVIGLSLAAVALQWIRASGAGAIPRIDEVALRWRTVAFSAVLAVVAAVLLGALAVPSLRKRDLWGALGSGRGGTSRSRWRLHRLLVAGEVAFASIVLIGAALVARTVSGILQQPLGFDASNVVSFRVEPPFRVNMDQPAERFIADLMADRRRVDEGYASLLAAIRDLPGVSEAGAINRLPLTGEFWVTSVGIAAGPAAAAGERHRIWVRPVTPGYLEAMRTRLLRGRSIARSDVAGGETVVVIDESFARRIWGSDDPIGRELFLDAPLDRVRRARVVGVAESVHMNRLDAEQGGTMYVSLAQSIEGFFPNWGMDVVVRGAGGLSQGAEFRRLVRTIFPDAVVFNITTMQALVAASVADRRFQLLVLGLFSLLALALATIGVGSALMLVVRERSNELAVRMALGAPAHRVWWQVQAGGLGVTAAGALAGTGAALAGARVFSSLVHDLSVRDPVSFAGAPLLLCTAAFVAVAIPATRAIRVSPVTALRES